MPSATISWTSIPSNFNPLLAASLPKRERIDFTSRGDCTSRTTPPTSFLWGSCSDSSLHATGKANSRSLLMSLVVRTTTWFGSAMPYDRRSLLTSSIDGLPLLGCQLGSSFKRGAHRPTASLLRWVNDAVAASASAARSGVGKLGMPLDMNSR